MRLLVIAETQGLQWMRCSTVPFSRYCFVNNNFTLTLFFPSLQLRGWVVHGLDYCAYTVNSTTGWGFDLRIVDSPLGWLVKCPCTFWLFTASHQVVCEVLSSHCVYYEAISRALFTPLYILDLCWCLRAFKPLRSCRLPGANNGTIIGLHDLVLAVSPACQIKMLR